MSTPNERLAAAMRELELETLAQQAEKGEYGDFTSPHATPKMVCCQHLAHAAAHHENRDAILKLRRRVMEGEFDG